MHQVPPGPSSRVSSSMVNVTRPWIDHAELFVVVPVFGNVGVGGELDEREGDPLALDPPGADGLAPDVDDRDRGEIDEVAHGSSWWTRSV